MSNNRDTSMNRRIDWREQLQEASIFYRGNKHCFRPIFFQQNITKSIHWRLHVTYFQLWLIAPRFFFTKDMRWFQFFSIKTCIACVSCLVSYHKTWDFDGFGVQIFPSSDLPSFCVQSRSHSLGKPQHWSATATFVACPKKAVVWMLITGNNTMIIAMSISIIYYRVLSYIIIYYHILYYHILYCHNCKQVYAHVHTLLVIEI